MIKIMIDSTSDCREMIEMYDYFIPLVVSLDGREYRSGIDLDSDGFYRLLTDSKDFPRTSQPSPGDFEAVFEKVKAEGDELIYFAVSSALSGTYQCACLAKAMVDYEGIHIVDTKAATHMIGILLKYADKLIDQGMSAGEIVKACEELRARVRVYAGLDTLEYLYRGGRVSRASAAVGEIAGIKPVIAITQGGTVDASGKCLGIPRAVNWIVDKVKKDDPDPDFPISALYSWGTENCEKLEKKLAMAGYPVNERLQLGSTIGAHTGPGVYAVMFVSR